LPKKILQDKQWNQKHKLSNLTTSVKVKSFYKSRFEPWKSASTAIFVNDNVAEFDSQQIKSESHCEQ